MINLDNKLLELRQLRNFNTENYIDSKCYAINRFFTINNLDSCVIGISGGIDSAVVLALLYKASCYDNSPIKKILAISMPIYSDGATEVNDSVNKAKYLFENLPNFDSKLDKQIIDLTDTHKNYVKAGDRKNTSFSDGQLLSIVRTPMLYYKAALLQDDGYKSIVVGTTNRDEGSYIGFFGKASDAMVDLQPIADIHKSEVYKVAKFLNVPKLIIDSTPKGNVHDGATDEEMIGASYDMIELFTLCLDYKCDINMFDSDKKYSTAFAAIQRMHFKNEHKYTRKNGCITPMGFSHYIDVMKRIININ